jgi:hypothetical protein
MKLILFIALIGSVIGLSYFNGEIRNGSRSTPTRVLTPP